MSPLVLNGLHFSSPLLLAPMSAICNAPFRLLMEDLGAGGTVSELISAHGINYKNKRTLDMLKLDPREKNVGLQVFGEDEECLSACVRIVEDYQPKFIDINMGCPVKKVVSKGGGSALLRDPLKLGHFFRTIKKEMSLPLTIKIRIGWDEQSINAHEVIHIAYNEGIQMVAVHGRTRAQAYTGNANWDYLNQLGLDSPLPIIGNGDLHNKNKVQHALRDSKCQALMLGRGPLRNPFLFLEAFDDQDQFEFEGKDYLEVTQKLFTYMMEYGFSSQLLHLQMRKHLLWFASGFQKAPSFRQDLFTMKSAEESLLLAEEFFLSQEKKQKILNDHESFMTSGHG
jgi:tRNA-dihydrouridine synthase B